MKYIRTKDAVMEYKKAIENIKYWFKNVAFEEYNIDTETDRLNKSIIKQANTIEELCDEFVSITEDLTPEILVPKYISPKDTLEIAWKNRFEDEMCYKNVVIKGAIWTDKGLIYKAKMKGVLPNGQIDWELL